MRKFRPGPYAIPCLLALAFITKIFLVLKHVMMISDSSSKEGVSVPRVFLRSSYCSENSFNTSGAALDAFKSVALTRLR